MSDSSLRFGPVYVNGKILSPEAALISIFDRGLLLADGLYETMRAGRGNIFRLGQHIERMRAGMRILRMGVEPEELYLTAAVHQTVEISGFEEARARLTVTRGQYTGSYAVEEAKRPTVVITVQDIGGSSPPTPMKAIISSFRRDETSPITRAKTLNVLSGVLARSEALELGAEDAIMLNTSGNVAESTSSNVFLVKQGCVITPDLDSGILPGVTREAVIEIAQTLGCTVEERLVSAAEIEDADEIFLTSSIAGIRSVVSLNGKSVGTGKYDVQERLAEEYAQLLVLEIG